MRRAFLVIAVVAFVSTSASAEQSARDYPIHLVPASDVKISDRFWSPRIEVNRTATIPLTIRMCEDTGRIENFKVAGKLSDKNWSGPFGFNDSDVFKVMEGVASSLKTHPDQQLRAYLDELVGYVAAAQEDDGYLFTAYTARDRIAPKQLRCCWPRDDLKWLSELDSHELYNCGHMYEAAVAHWEATGDARFLNVARKSADLLVETFGPGKTELPPGHPEVELALVKLYRATQDERYLKLSEYFLDVRGRKTGDRPELWGENRLDHKPLVEQDEAVGHAVRAMYLYSAATDVAALTDNVQLSEAMDRLWENVVGKKTYVTGGIGASREGEEFGDNYHLPNETAYAETCANVATCLWNERMFLRSGDGKYIDMLERALYNSAISGVALDGTSFFYPNPLASLGGYSRSKWFECACCPSTICRFIPTLPEYVYAASDDQLYVNLFVGGTGEVQLANGKVLVKQETSYPWDGQVTLDVTPQSPDQRFTLAVRIPGWARGEAFPSDLYRFSDATDSKHSMTINGDDVRADVTNGYVLLKREWQPGDRVVLDLPMQVRRLVANSNVEANQGRVCLQRGPIVYCVEWPDVEGGEVKSLVLADDAKLISKFLPDLLCGVQVITGTMKRPAPANSDSNQADTKEPRYSDAKKWDSVPFVAIPYFAWAHRGPGEMSVWITRSNQD